MSGKQTAGAFDVRSVIAYLIGLYGVVLTLMGLFDNSEATLAKSAGVNANLWSGIGMLVFAVGFLLWVRLRPVEVPDEVVKDDRPAGH